MNKATYLPPMLLVGVGMLLATSTGAAQEKPNVAILVYDGVQVIDHAIPYEVFGQYSLNHVYTVAKEDDPLTTYMGMRILPNYTFEDAPPPDVLVLPGGDARGARQDSVIMDWVRRNAATADYVLTICTGTFFLVGNDLLNDARVTTWFDRQDDLRRAAPGAEVVGEEIVVEHGKLVSAAGTGIEGALRVLAKLHGEAWAEVVRLNMEHEPVPASAHVPRVELADLKLPDAIYAAFPWRRATLRRYDGDRDAWTMTWQFSTEVPMDSLRSTFMRALSGEDGWALVDQESSASPWTSRWRVDTGREGEWEGEMTLSHGGTQVGLEVRVRRAEGR